MIKARARDILVSLPLVILMLAGACASPGTPSGGPRDEDPPRYVRSTPPLGTTDVDASRIDIYFDEIVNVKDAFSKVVVSPTGAETPKVTSLGRRVRVAFADTLQTNTTYTIDFGNAIEDNNEGNKLTGFTYYFSTGPEIDSLRISGMVLNAHTLEPQQGMLVGVYSQLDDTTFQRRRLERVAKTDDRGRFTLRGLKEGPYHLFALGDLNNDFRWDNPDEEMAFFGHPVYPTSAPSETVDTIWNMKTGAVDTVYTRARTTFLPNDILLNSFNLGYKSQYLVNNERVDSTRISLVFNAPSDSLPKVSLPGRGYSVDDNDWYLLERNATNDTLTYWLRPERLISADTLRLAATYLRTDSLNSLSWHNDTLRLVTKRAKKANPKSDKKKQDAEVVEVPNLGMKMLTGSTQEYYLPLLMEFDTPLDTLFQTAFRLEQKQDTLWLPVKKPLEVVPFDSLSVRRYKIEYPWDYGGEYRLNVDTLAATGIYGLATRPLEHSFKVKREDEYSNLRLTLTGLPDSIPAFVELLDGSDKLLRTAVVENGSAIFRWLAPGTYYARVVEDLNGNGRYDSGDYARGHQPELAYYYPKALKLKSNWDVDQSWDVFAVNIDLQKPLAIKKNKPERTKADQYNRQQDEEEDDEVFDASRNPFDPNSGRKNSRNAASSSTAGRSSSNPLRR